MFVTIFSNFHFFGINFARFFSILRSKTLKSLQKVLDSASNLLKDRNIAGWADLADENERRQTAGNILSAIEDSSRYLASIQTDRDRSHPVSVYSTPNIGWF